MNLTKLFNFDYMYENMKKSKVALLLCVLVLPLFTSIMLLTVDTEVYGFSELGIFNILLMYVIPFIISANLFGYVYKKNSVDFIGSMPLTRKTIFLTNTLAGIMLILFSQLLTLLCTMMIATFSSSIIFAGIAWDVFLYQTFAYIFVFTIANIAMSISGNVMTQIVATLLITFLVPTLYTFTYYAAEENVGYVMNEGIYTTITPISHFENLTAPSLILSSFEGGGYGFSAGSLVKMVILSVIYTGIGLYLFQRRKMEKAGESFIKKSTHFLIKALTLVPFVMIMKIVCMSHDYEVLPFMIGVTVTYWFVYDLITSKKMKFWQNVGTYVVSTVSIFGLITLLIWGTEAILKLNINTNDIAKLELESRYYPNNRMNGKYVITDPDLIHLIVENGNDDTTKEINKEILSESTYMSGIAYLKGGKKYGITVLVDGRDMPKVIACQEETMKLPKNKDLRVYLNAKIAKYTDKKELNNILKQITPYEIRKSDRFESYFTSYSYYPTEKIEGYHIDVHAYEYIDHQLYQYSYTEAQSKELSELLTKIHNKAAYYLAKENRDPNDIYYTVRDNQYYYNTYYERDVKAELIRYLIENHQEEVNLNQPYIRVRINFRNTGSSVTAYYTTNHVEDVIAKFTYSVEEDEPERYFDATEWIEKEADEEVLDDTIMEVYTIEE